MRPPHPPSLPLRAATIANSAGRDDPGEHERSSQGRRCEHSQDCQSRPDHQGGLAGKCQTSRHGVDRRSQTAVAAIATAVTEIATQNQRQGRRKKSAKPVGKSATALKTAMKRSPSPKAYIPADASASGPLVLAIRTATTAVATSTAAR